MECASTERICYECAKDFSTLLTNRFRFATRNGSKTKDVNYRSMRNSEESGFSPACIEHAAIMPGDVNKHNKPGALLLAFDCMSSVDKFMCDAHKSFDRSFGATGLHAESRDNNRREIFTAALVLDRATHLASRTNNT